MNWEQQIGKLADLKNIAIGLLLGICVMLLTGAGANDQGPFQNCRAGENDTAIFVTDTRDGHTWRFSRTEFDDFGTPLSPKMRQAGEMPKVK
jgi:hypothetical protein